MDGLKKRRLQGSCDRCRSRKIACDSAEMPGAKCSHCITAGAECSHIGAKSRKNHPIPQHSLHTELGEDIQSHISAILSTTVPYAIPDSRMMRPLLTGLARYARELEDKIARLEKQLELSSPAESAVETMSEPMDRLTISESTNFGASDGVQFIRTAANIVGTNPEPGQRRPEFWTTPPWQSQTIPELATLPLLFPPPDLLDSLVDIFLDSTNDHICVLLHGPSFKRDIANGIHYTSREFGSVVLAVCAVAARSSNDPRIHYGHEAGWEWFRQLRVIDPATFESPACLWDLQLVVLMVSYMHGMAIVGPIWLLIGMGTRLGQAMGVHRKRRKDGVEWTPLDELLTRAWWALVCLDIYAAGMFGGARATHSDDYDADYPLETDDEYWPGELLADPTQPWRQPTGVPSQITSWVLQVKLLEIFSFAQRTIYSTKRSSFWDAISTAEWGHNIAVELDSALNIWVDAIPDHLRWNPNFPTDASACLYASYYWVQIQIHRPFIRGDRSRPESFASVAMCTNAARSCAHVFSAHQRAFSTRAISIMNMFSALLHSSIVLLLAVADGSLATSRDLQDVHGMMDILKSHEGKWRIAGRLRDMLREIVFLLRVPDDISEPNLRKRKDHDQPPD